MSEQEKVREISARLYAGGRLSLEDGLSLYHHADLAELAEMADWMRWRKHPQPIVTYIVGRNINYTNVCWVRCAFCAFYRPPGSEDGYVLSREEIFDKIREMVDAGGIEILMQGGLNPKLKIDYFEDLFRSIKQNFKVHIHSLSPTEILYIAHLSRLTIQETISRLRVAGLDTIPGAGGEILVDEVRERIAPHKESTDEWLGVMRTAHALGMRTTATMMYGSVERIQHRLEHLMRVRELQDETGGFTAFIPWNYQPGGTALGGTKTDSIEYLKMVALCRILLDNIDNIQASWVTQGAGIAQVSLHYGVNDFGSTMFEENVVKAAGTTFFMDEGEVRRQIRSAGFEPHPRNTYYQLLD
ncbi:MAG: dehypoxanthine futalosine cyclase [Acidobacteriia bacterium]|nr:dehypoxanthine futalosine cyclase [Terriglobia bacterium]